MPWKYQRNDSPRHDGKTWEEDSTNVVVINDHAVAPNCTPEIEVNDKVVFSLPIKGGKCKAHQHIYIQEHARDPNQS